MIAIVSEHRDSDCEDFFSWRCLLVLIGRFFRTGYDEFLTEDIVFEVSEGSKICTEGTETVPLIDGVGSLAGRCRFR